MSGSVNDVKTELLARIGTVDNIRRCPETGNGCGCNRDITKRARMGRVADTLADFCILTSDNPRGEDPQWIVEQIKEGFERENYQVILDRQEAIHRALSLAQSGDVVLIAGKGHEDYQIFKDRTIHFDDREVAREYFAERKSLYT